MKKILNSTVLSLALFASAHGSKPTGFLDADSLLVREGGITNLNWNVEFPEDSLDEIVEIDPDENTITPRKNLEMEIKVLGVAFGGSNDPFFVRASYKAGNSRFQSLFNGRAPEVRPWETATSHDVERNEEILFGFHGAEGSGPSTPFANWNWKTPLLSKTGDNRMMILRNGDIVPRTVPAFDQGEITSFLEPYLSSDGRRVVLGEMDIIVLTELSDYYHGDSRADYQDCVLLVTFSEEQRRGSHRGDDDD